jgi:hypothetical protein
MAVQEVMPMAEMPVMAVQEELLVMAVALMETAELQAMAAKMRTIPEAATMPMAETTIMPMVDGSTVTAEATIMPMVQQAVTAILQMVEVPMVDPAVSVTTE